MKSEEGRLGIDIPTLVAISTMAWILVNVSHEIMGHAGAAALLGIPVRAVSTTAASIAGDQVLSIGAYRTIMAAGTIMNMVGGAGALILLRVQKQANSAKRYFLWLFATFSFVIVAMNLVSVMLIDAGDWTEVSRALEPGRLWKAIIIGAGVIIAIFGFIMPLRLWMPDLRDNRRAQFTITVIPVVTLIVVQSLSLIGSPLARLPSGADHWLACLFAYIHFIAWAILVNALRIPRSEDPAESLRLPRSYGWLVVALVVAVFYVAVLGAGIGSA
ncbi:MAG: hypothetical protein BWY63_03251 [Chloroflexi bacterium ADurb.Bin360]|nr:MAG: hypothetical protein BWY63_03251 [Chloroflexi bacterium ADurb.Bin360]